MKFKICAGVDSPSPSSSCNIDLSTTLKYFSLRLENIEKEEGDHSITFQSDKQSDFTVFIEST